MNIEGTLDGAGRRFGIVAARFNGRVVEALLAGARDALRRHHVAADDILVLRVPGAWELPQGLQALVGADAGLHGLVALGAVIRGETDHYDWICREAHRGIAAVARECGLPVGLGVLTCADSSLAWERAGGKAGNKGFEAAMAALEMADVQQRLQAAATAPRVAASPRFEV